MNGTSRATISGMSDRISASIRASSGAFFSGGSETQPGPPPTMTPA
jgi:hypothetical protein